MNLDTTFLIDLNRELSGKPAKGAFRFLQTHSSTRFHISVVAALEFLEGFSDTARGNRYLTPFKQVDFDSQMGYLASQIRRDLRKKGALIGDYDILIAATALQMGEPLVTANMAHFQRVPGLTCIPYRP